MNARRKAAAKTAVTKLLDRQRCAVRNEDPDRPIYKRVEKLLLTLTSLNARRLAGHPTPPPGVRWSADVLWLLDALSGAKESRAGERGAPESLTMDRASALVLDTLGVLVWDVLVILNSPDAKRAANLCADTRTQLTSLQSLLRMIEGKLRGGDEQ